VKEADNLYLLDLFQSQKYSEAADYLKQVYPEPISDKKVLSRFGYSLKMAGKMSEAEKYYLRILEQDSTDMSSLFSMAGINQSKGNYGKATDYYKLILKIDSNNFSVYKQLSNLVEASQGLLFALPYLAKANELNPVDGDIAYSLAKVFKEGKRLDLAEKVLDTAIAADSTNLILLRGKAELAFTAKNWPSVIKMCDRLVAEGETNANILKMLGQSHYYVKNYDKCIQILLAMEENLMQSEATMYYIALSYKAKKNYPKAIEYFNKTIKESISANTGEYYAQIGDIHEKNNQVRPALAAYQRSVTFDVKPITLYSVATFYDDKVKDKSSALRYYKKYLNTKPGQDHLAYIDYSKYRIEQLSK
jgi:tetratricopeptide (TPR) repeat protein